MKNNDLISIVIPCYNDWQYIEKAVDSALKQTYQYKEVIVVDDGSNFKTKEILKHLESKITKLITQENQGQSKARNVGIEASKGEYILVLDSDDYFEPTFCEKASSLLKENKNINIVTSYTKRFNDLSSYDYYPQGGFLRDFLLNNHATGSLMFRKENWLNVGGYDETMRYGFEDWEFYIRLLKNGGEAFVIPEFLFNYRSKEDSTTIKANKIKYALLLFIYEKHKDLYCLYFHDFVTNLLSKIEREEKEKLKVYQKIDYRIGSMILKPLRFVKSKLKRKAV